MVRVDDDQRSNVATQTAASDSVAPNVSYTLFPPTATRPGPPAMMLRISRTGCGCAPKTASSRGTRAEPKGQTRRLQDHTPPSHCQPA